ncbi:hypothetical protein [Haladaptatus sp. NG-SE-30]
MTDTRFSRMPIRDEFKRGVVGGVLLAAIYISGYLFLYQFVTADDESAWSIGTFGLSTGLLPETIHLGFLVLPGFVVSVAVVGFHRWHSSERDRRTDASLLLVLIMIPVLIGAVVGIGLSLLVFGRLLFSGGIGEVVSFVLVLILTLAVILVNGVVMLAAIAIGALAGYLVVGTMSAILEFSTTDGT